MKIDAFMKRFTDLFKEAGLDKASDAAEHPLKASADKLAAAIAAYGDGAGLAADHPLHALKALHKEMSDNMVEAAAKSAADKEAAAKASAEPDGDEGDDVTKANIQEEVNKALVDVNKALEAANKRADDAEKIAKSERDARELEGEKATLRKFKHVTVDVEKDAPMFAKMRTADRPAYDFLISRLEGAEAVAKQAAILGKDLGSPMGGDGGQTAWAQIEAEAAKIVAKGAAGITNEKAIDQVMKEQPDLVKRYKAEKAGQVS